ncbi:hypothetical protein QQ045_006893 [Rhodiola kirilowii]
MTLHTLLPIECTPIRVLGLEHPEAGIQVTNNLGDNQSMTVTCFESFKGDTILNEPVHLAHIKSYTFLCRIRIMGVSCRCKLASSVWTGVKEFSAYKFHRDHHLCDGDNCRWNVFIDGVALVYPFGPVDPKGCIKFYNWDDAM